MKFGVPSPVICARPHQHHHQAPTTPNTTHRVPALRGVEARRAAAARQVVALDNVVQPALRRRRAIQPRVEEAEHAPALAEQPVVDERDDRRERRRRAARAAHDERRPARDDVVPRAVRGDVRVRAPGRVEEPGRVRAERGEVGRDRGGLVGRLREVVREAAAGEGGGDLVGLVRRRADSGHAVRGQTWEMKIRNGGTPTRDSWRGRRARTACSCWMLGCPTRRRRQRQRGRRPRVHQAVRRRYRSSCGNVSNAPR